jgi:hypothetical protein
LCIDFSFVDLTGSRDRSLDGVLRDLVEQDALDWSAILAPDLTRDVPRYRFTFAIGVSRKENLPRVPRGILQVCQGFFFSGNRYVLGLEPVLDVDSNFLFGQIANVPDCRTNTIPAAQVLADRLGFRGRFDNDERGRSRFGRWSFVYGRRVLASARLCGLFRGCFFCCAFFAVAI